MVEDEVEWLGTKASELLDAYGPKPRDHARLGTFEDVEAFWEREGRPVLSEFRSMQNRWSDGEDLPESSVWFPNWRVPDRG